jgi:hypothetical protein
LFHVVSSFPSEPKNSNQAIEVRLGPQGVKAKYVRVELRKIETIPGLPPNSYYDFVGQSPVNLWRSSEEYSMLHSVRLLMLARFSSYLSFNSPPSARYSFLHSNTRVHSPNSHARKRRYVPSSDPSALPLISGTFKLVLSTSSWVKCAFEASRTYSILCRYHASLHTRLLWI